MKLRSLVASRPKDLSQPQNLYQLIVQADGSEPGYSLTLSSGSQKLESGQLPDLAVVDTKSAALFPGSIVQGEAAYIQAGKLIPNPLPRSGGTLTVSGVQFTGGPASLHVTETTAATVAQALRQLMNERVAPGQAGETYCSFTQVYSAAQASYQVNASFGYLSLANLSNTFQSANDTRSNHVLINCQEQYFTVSFMPDSTPTSLGYEAYFAPNLSMDLVKRYIGTGNPPLVLSSVTYGSELFVIADSKSSVSDMMDALKAAVGFSGFSASGSFTTHQQSVLKSISVAALAIGGRASAQEGILTAMTPDQVPAALVSYLHNSLDIAASGGAAQEYGLPISYDLSYLDFNDVGETATIYGTPYQASPAVLKWAKVHFHQDGDGKDWDTEVDLMLKDGQGGIVALNHLGKHTDFGDNTTTQDYPINPTKPISKEELLDSGSFDMIIHPNGHDHWNYTAYLSLGFDDNTSAIGITQNWEDQNMTGRSTKLNTFIH
jgi:hypothetical protein